MSQKQSKWWIQRMDGSGQHDPGPELQTMVKWTQESWLDAEEALTAVEPLLLARYREQLLNDNAIFAAQARSALEGALDRLAFKNDGKARK